MRTDLQHLRLLAIFHYVLGGLVGLMACFPGIYLAIGIGIVSGSMGPSGPGAPPQAIGWFFIVFASMFILLGWVFAVCLFISGHFLNTQKAYVFCLVVAGISCLFQPLGTILGIFTIVVLQRPRVKELFGREPFRLGRVYEDDYPDERGERRELRERRDRLGPTDPYDAEDRGGFILPDRPGR